MADNAPLKYRLLDAAKRLENENYHQDASVLREAAAALKDEPRQITKGLLDALVLTPIGMPGRAPTQLDITIRGLPGFWARLQIGAVQELRQAFDIILGPRPGLPDKAGVLAELRASLRICEIALKHSEVSGEPSEARADGAKRAQRLRDAIRFIEENANGSGP